MLNEEYIENCIKDCLNSNNQLSEEKFLNLFSGLDDDEQQEVFQIMLKNNWSLASSEEKLEAPEYTKQSDQVNLSSISKLNNLSNEELCVLYQNGNQTALAALITKNRGFIYQIAHNLHKQYYSSDLDLDDEFSEGELGIITAAQKFDYTSGYKFLTYAWWWIIQAIIRAEINYGYSVRLPVHAFEAITKINKIYESNQQLSIKEITEIYNNKVPDTKALTPKQVSYYLACYRNYIHYIKLDEPTGESGEQSTIVDLLPSEQPSTEAIIIQESLVKDIDNCLDVLDERERDIIIHRFGLFGEQELTLEEIACCYHITRERIRQIEVKALNKLI